MREREQHLRGERERLCCGNFHGDELMMREYNSRMITGRILHDFLVDPLGFCRILNGSTEGPVKNPIPTMLLVRNWISDCTLSHA